MHFIFKIHKKALAKPIAVIVINRMPLKKDFASCKASRSVKVKQVKIVNKVAVQKLTDKCSQSQHAIRAN